MAGMQDSLTIGIVLFLLIAALGVYMWLRFQQVETRLTLTESILLDMKMVAQAYSQFPNVPVEDNPESTPAPHATDMKTVSFNAAPITTSTNAPIINITKMESSMINTTDEVQPLTELFSAENNFPSVLDEIKKEMEASSLNEAKANSSIEVLSGDITIHQTIPSILHGIVESEYNGMTLKDLRSLAKMRGISGVNSMNRSQLISILQEKDTSVNEPMQIEYETEIINE
jgi:hypothetical protein